MIPASSFQGKTTLVKELIKLGAKYYSDEYAVLDENGLVHPFPKTLSVRGINGNPEQVELPAEFYGAQTGTKACEVGLVLMTSYQKDASWEPRVISKGQGVLEIIQHTLSIRSNTKFTMRVLNKVVTNAIICKSLRGNASKTAKTVLEFFGDVNS